MIALGCGIEGLLALPAKSVDLVLSDLPSGKTRAVFDSRADLEGLARAVEHVVKPGGGVVLMASHWSFAADVARIVPGFRCERIWHKARATGFLNAKRRPLMAHEYILVFGRGPYTPQMTTGHKPIKSNRRQGSHGANYGAPGRETKARAGATDRYPTTVLRTKTVGTTSPERRHPQQKPIELLDELVRTYSLPDALVVDPFSGSGSTGIAALRAGRRFKGWDTSAEFVKRANEALQRCS